MKKYAEIVSKLNHMELAIYMMDISGTSPEEMEKLSETDSISTTTKPRKRISRKAQRSKRRKVSIRHDRKNRANEALNVERRNNWVLENFCWLGYSKPFKHKKEQIKLSSLLQDSDIPVTED